MPSGPQLMPIGLVAVAIVTAAPPVTAIRLIVLSPDVKNATDWPLGENTGLMTFGSSVPVIGLASTSDSERRYNRLFATYTMRAPSGEMATVFRPALVNV